MRSVAGVVTETATRTVSRRETLVVAIVAALFGAWFVGWGNVLPGSMAWLDIGDVGASQAAWEYFRAAPLIQWPITALPNYGVEWGSIFPGIAGNTLVALPLKVLSPLLPDEFQYLGAWVVTCFVAQAVILQRLFAATGLGRTERLLGALVVTLSPILLFRIGVLMHLDLGGQWLIALSLLLYRSAPARSRRWWAFFLVAAAVNVYLFAMTFAVWCAAWWRDEVQPPTRTMSRALTGFVLAAIAALGSIWVLGYLTFSDSATGYGFFRVNTAAFINPGYSPTESFSGLLDRFGSLRARQFAAEEGEGFAYVGLAPLLAVPFLVAALIAGRMRWLRRNGALAVVTMLLFVVAVSNRVVVVRREWTYWWPDVLLDARQVFRSSGRFAWLLAYVLAVAGWIAFSRWSRGLGRFASAALVAVAVLHVVDIVPGIRTTHETLSAPKPDTTTFDSDRWDDIITNRPELSIVPTFDIQADGHGPAASYWIDSGRWYDIIRFGAEHNLGLNFAYVGRPVVDEVNRANERNAQTILRGRPEPGTVYLFADESEWNTARTKLDDSGDAFVLDEYFVIVGPPASLE